ncbi:MAG: molybdenum cofactor guanylyltransferase [Opitutales bacterium]
MTASSEINGVVLAGGHSSRMGRDKAALIFQGQTLLGRAKRALRPICQAVFVSVRKDQRIPREFEPDRVVRDAFGLAGALGGIASVLATQPNHAWLVLACDLPHVEPELLQELLANRDPASDATAFVSDNGRTEALCTLYEPSALEKLQQRIETGLFDLGPAMDCLHVRRLRLLNADWLRSVKNQEQYETAFNQQMQTPNPFFGSAAHEQLRGRFPQVG